MELQFNETEHGIRHLKPIGTLDIMGVNEIETKFTGYCAGEAPQVVVDLSGVGFLASIGIRLLMLTAKAVQSRGGRVVLAAPIEEVRNVLEITGIPNVIPLFPSLAAAEQSLRASA